MDLGGGDGDGMLSALGVGGWWSEVGGVLGECIAWGVCLHSFGGGGFAVWRSLGGGFGV